MGLDIGDITMGYSKQGAVQYVNELNTQVITDTSRIISQEYNNIINALQKGWQGASMLSFQDRLDKQTQALKDKLREMEELFNATLAGQEVSYHEGELGMIEEINKLNPLGE
jgi:hypothetical protein